MQESDSNEGMPCYDIYEEASKLINKMDHSDTDCSDLDSSRFRKTKLTEMAEFENPNSLPEKIIEEMESAEDQSVYISILCEWYNRVVQENDHINVTGFETFEGSLPCFNASYYLQRISVYSGASPCCLIASLIYLERIQKLCPSLKLSSRSLQRLLAVAVMTATKFLEDDCCLNSRWAEISGLSLEELNSLELDFLFCIEFRLAISPKQYSRCKSRLAAFATTYAPNAVAVAESKCGNMCGQTSPLRISRSRSSDSTCSHDQPAESGGDAASESVPPGDAAALGGCRNGRAEIPHALVAEPPRRME